MYTCTYLGFLAQSSHMRYRAKRLPSTSSDTLCMMWFGVILVTAHDDMLGYMTSTRASFALKRTRASFQPCCELVFENHLFVIGYAISQIICLTTII